MNICTKKKLERTKILIYPAWNKIFKIWDTFWAHTNKRRMQQKLFRIFFTTRSWSYWRQRRKPQKPRPNLKKYVYYVFTENICFAWSPMQVTNSFLQKYTLVTKSFGHIVKISVNYFGQNRKNCSVLFLVN